MTNHHKFSQLHVLLIEPSHTQQLIITNYLHQAGVVNIECIESGFEALRVIPKLLPELVISAMYLPDMTGDDLLLAIRETKDAYAMAFLLISSETKLEYLEPIRQAGAIAILPKPFSQEQLIFALEATLDYVKPEIIQLQHFNTEDLQILVVDDSSTFLKYLSHLLNDLGIENIATAKDGTEALDIIATQYFDLIITDYNMPNMDGLEMVNQIRHGKKQNNIPILMITSEQSEERLTLLKNSGVSAVVDKPFAPAIIKNLITRLLN